MEKIKSITEAFSMQPCTHFANDKATRATECREIKKEYVKINGDPFEYFIGYNADKQKLFAFRCETVSVEYKVD